MEAGCAYATHSAVFNWLYLATSCGGSLKLDETKIRSAFNTINLHARFSREKIIFNDLQKFTALCMCEMLKIEITYMRRGLSLTFVAQNLIKQRETHSEFAFAPRMPSILIESQWKFPSYWRLKQTVRCEVLSDFVGIPRNNWSHHTRRWQAERKRRRWRHVASKCAFAFA